MAGIGWSTVLSDWTFLSGERRLKAPKVDSMKRFSIILGVLIISASLAVAEVPRLNVQATCRATPAVNLDQQATYDNCIRSENAARDKLRQAWGNMRADWRSNCLKTTTLGGLPSYVELLTCVEMREAALNGQSGLGSGAGAGLARGSGSPNINSPTPGAVTEGTAGTRGFPSGPTSAPGNPGNTMNRGLGAGSAGPAGRAGIGSSGSPTVSSPGAGGSAGTAGTGSAGGAGSAGSGSSGGGGGH
jgi:hypothetical protein